jgi:hypothetical protein
VPEDLAAQAPLARQLVPLAAIHYLTQLLRPVAAAVVLKVQIITASLEGLAEALQHLLLRVEQEVLETHQTLRRHKVTEVEMQRIQEMQVFILEAAALVVKRQMPVLQEEMQLQFQQEEVLVQIHQ